MKMPNIKLILLAIVFCIILGFVPVWPKRVKSGYIKINTWTKIQTSLGLIFID